MLADSTRGWQRPASRAILLPLPCLSPSLGRLLRGFSLPCLPATGSPWTRLFSALCCSAVVPSTCSVTTALLAPARGYRCQQCSRARPQHPPRAIGLPLWGGAQLAVDTTLVSPLDASGAARRHQRQYRGAALRLARRAQERTYPELLRSQRCRLVVLALEVGGRWSSEAAQFVRLLARRAVLRPLRPATLAAFTSRWSALLACSAPEHSVPVSLVFPSPAPPTLTATSPCSARSFPRLASTRPAFCQPLATAPVSCSLGLGCGGR